MSAPTLIAEKAGLRVERVVTSGTFSLDGGTWDVDNNVWLIGTAEEVIVIDAAHDADSIIGAVAGRAATAVICTHGHNDHINVATNSAKRCTPRFCYIPAMPCCGGTCMQTSGSWHSTSLTASASPERTST